ncbi:unnamed protein product [Closterium sp. NIES-65]|nr:unnamed protein product [Closterium sp. NIES-65]
MTCRCQQGPWRDGRLSDSDGSRDAFDGAGYDDAAPFISSSEHSRRSGAPFCAPLRFGGVRHLRPLLLALVIAAADLLFPACSWRSFRLLRAGGGDFPPTGNGDALAPPSPLTPLNESYGHVSCSLTALRGGKRHQASQQHALPPLAVPTPPLVRIAPSSPPPYILPTTASPLPPPLPTLSPPPPPLAACPLSRLYLPQAVAAAAGDGANAIAAAAPGVSADASTPTATAAAVAPPLQWTPQAHKYILMHCDSGQISNWVHCIRMHLLFAGLLSRTLLVNALPSETKRAYNYSLLFDISHARQCYGTSAVQTTEEYYNEYGKKVELDRVLCWSYPSFEGLEHPLAWGDLPFQRLPGCLSTLAVQPDARIVQAAEDFVDEKFRQKPFLSLHMRAGDLRASCERQQLDVGCRLGPHQVVACVKRKLRVHRLMSLFIATNAGHSEVQQVKQLFQGRDPAPPPPPGAPILPPGLTTQVVTGVHGWPGLKRWFGALDETQLKQVEAEVEKVVAVRGTVFQGTCTSTFSLDVERMRLALGRGSCHDSFVCDEEIAVGEVVNESERKGCRTEFLFW